METLKAIQHCFSYTVILIQNDIMRHSWWGGFPLFAVFSNSQEVVITIPFPAQQIFLNLYISTCVANTCIWKVSPSYDLNISNNTRSSLSLCIHLKPSPQTLSQSCPSRLRSSPGSSTSWQQTCLSQLPAKFTFTFRSFKKCFHLHWLGNFLGCNCWLHSTGSGIHPEMYIWKWQENAFMKDVSLLINL